MLRAKHNNTFKNVTPRVLVYGKSGIFYPYEIYTKGENNFIHCWPDVSVKRVANSYSTIRSCWVEPLKKYVGIGTAGEMYTSADGITYSSASQSFARATCFGEEVYIRPRLLVYDSVHDTLFAPNEYRPFIGAVWKNVSTTVGINNPEYFNINTFSYHYIYAAYANRHIILGLHPSGRGDYPYQVAYSDNGGVTWTTQNSGFETPSFGNGFCWQNKCYYFPYSGGSIHYSSNGQNWTPATMRFSYNGNDNYPFTAIGVADVSEMFIDNNNTRLMFAFQDFKTSKILALVSYDAVNWKIYDILPDFKSFAGMGYSKKFKRYYTVDGGNSADNRLYLSEDGITWTYKNLPKKAVDTYRQIVKKVDEKIVMSEGDYYNYLLKINHL